MGSTLQSEQMRDAKHCFGVGRALDKRSLCGSERFLQLVLGGGEPGRALLLKCINGSSMLQREANIIQTV